MSTTERDEETGLPPERGATEVSRYWDRYAAGVDTETREEALKSAFGWTQYAGHGPGAELLGNPGSALELGCGRGNAVAALALKGIDATGVDISGAQYREAMGRWGHIPSASFGHVDIVEYLSSADRQWDAVFSIWGALWFVAPDTWMPLVHERLHPKGRLVFSHAPAVPGSYGVQGMYGNGFRGPQSWIYRWAYEPQVWEELLRDMGFEQARVWVEPAPEADHVGTLIGVAHRNQT